MILGIQMGITSGVAVYDNGRIIYAASEERFTRIKNDSSYPINALKNDVRICHITPEKIEKVVMPSRKMSPVNFLCDIGTFSIKDWLQEEYEYYGPKLLPERFNSEEKGGVFKCV